MVKFTKHILVCCVAIPIFYVTLVFHIITSILNKISWLTNNIANDLVDLLIYIDNKTGE